MENNNSTEIRDDRVGAYLVPHLNEFIFDELSDSYLERAGISEFMTGVPVPIRKTELESISTLTLARNMAFVIGCDPDFQYKDSYIKYILYNFDKQFSEGLIADGVEGAQKNDFDYACIQFRAAFLIDPDNADAYYCYGRACKDAYEMGEEEDFIARFKAEALEAFEIATLKRPDFAEAYYFLGYGYINMGLYIKAKLSWEEFIKLSDNADMKKEIEERLSVMDEPVAIEKGYNLVISGRYLEGIEALSGYKEGKFSEWWPLWYYLGTAYEALGEDEEAIEHLLKVLAFSPSNIDTMEMLVKLYERQGSTEKAEKYKKKIEVIRDNIKLDCKEAEENRELKHAKNSPKLS